MGSDGAWSCWGRRDSALSWEGCPWLHVQFHHRPVDMRVCVYIYICTHAHTYNEIPRVLQLVYFASKGPFTVVLFRVMGTRGLELYFASEN